ncbi:hypothetical protein SRHO_G00305370 [Serrasalmus rhombeus]
MVLVMSVLRLSWDQPVSAYSTGADADTGPTKPEETWTNSFSVMIQMPDAKAPETSAFRDRGLSCELLLDLPETGIFSGVAVESVQFMC